MTEQDASAAERAWDAKELAIAFEYCMGADAEAPVELDAHGARLALEAMRTVYGGIIDEALPLAMRLAGAQAARKVAEEAGAPRVIVVRLWEEVEAAAEAFKTLPWQSEWEDRKIPEVIRSYLKLLGLSAPLAPADA